MAKTKTKNLPKKQHNPIPFRLSEITLIESVLNISDDFEIVLDNKLRYNLNILVQYNIKESSIEIFVTYEFLNGELQLNKLIVLNKYLIVGLNSFIINDNFTDKGFISYLSNLSVVHTRGVHSVLIKDTKLKGFYLPLNVDTEHYTQTFIR